ncbi:formin-like protein 7 [Amphibalanus amphitrite]|uniref:formin-like protein 7 n=1 Tax=Amphibalanus amphitrite TaxID=1232801 RepID=UPI001C926F28|nr:formin-like protein 7 [Amphibalanus amphitrite]
MSRNPASSSFQFSSTPVPSFVRIRRMDGSPLSDLSPWAVGDALSSAIGRCPRARPLRGGDLLVACEASEKRVLLGLRRIAGAEVKVWAPPHLNQSQGSIYAPSLQHLSLSELEEGFSRVGVTAVYRPPRSPKVLILTFSTAEPPPYILAAYLSFPVRAVPPKPLRCRRCQRYGHRQQHCRSDSPTCSNCAEAGHESSQCPAEDPLCAGCGGAHTANDPSCPRWISETQVTLLIRRGWNPRDARAYVDSHPSSNPVPPPSTSVRPSHPPPLTEAEYPHLPKSHSSSGRSPAPPPSHYRPTPPPRPASVQSGAARSAQRLEVAAQTPPGVSDRDPRRRPANPPPSEEPTPRPGASVGTEPEPVPKNRPPPPPRSSDESNDSSQSASTSNSTSPTSPPKTRRTRLQSAPSDFHFTLRHKQ